MDGKSEFIRNYAVQNKYNNELLNVYAKNFHDYNSPKVLKKITNNT